MIPMLGFMKSTSKHRIGSLESCETFCYVKDPVRKSLNLSSRLQLLIFGSSNALNPQTWPKGYAVEGLRLRVQELKEVSG